MLQLPALALAAAHGDAQLLHVQAAAGLLFMLHLRSRHRGRAQGAGLQEEEFTLTKHKNGTQK